jgi:Rad3-related DNA helicase
LWSIKNNSKIVVEFLKDFYEAVRWKTLTLFTSFYSIREVYTTLNFHLKKLWINLYPQWIWWWKSKLINFYLESPDNSILLWTDSFWEWIDIPWDNLKYLVIHKIPFMVPNDPIFLARSSLFKNPFTDYSIPKSIIKLKQWFWRLIRSKKDTGLVILLDDRIYSTDWWSMFYDAFPREINIKKCSSKIFLDLLNKDK